MSLNPASGDHVGHVPLTAAGQGPDASTIPGQRTIRRGLPVQPHDATATGLRVPARRRHAGTPEQREIVLLLRTALTPGPVPAAGGRDLRTPASTDASDRPPTQVGLSVVYQVMVDLASGRPVGVEALARLRDGRGRVVPPAVFIPVAERTGLIGPLGRHVLETACADLAGWHARHPAWRHLGVSVNFSAHQADLSDVAAEVRATLRRSGLAAGSLTLELTETVMLEAGHAAVRVLHELREEGVKIALDDFGTGYASLRQLAGLPVTSVKIDQSFTAGLPDDPTSVAIVRAVLGLARELGLTCVIEGIETAVQREYLTRDLRPVGVEGRSGVIGQGHLLGRPLPAHAVESRLLHTGHPAR